MPGSLLLSNDAYSDVSDISGRSLDSKIGGKKVSFNRAVRVKQYPWKSDVEHHDADHLTLPSTRFWFKVYKSKEDAPDGDNQVYDRSVKTNPWEDESMEYIHDSLAPIAEVEDQDFETQPTRLLRANGNKEWNTYSSLNNHNGFCHTSVDPPIDYANERQSSYNPVYGGVKHAWNSDNINGGSYPSRDYSSSTSLWDRSSNNNCSGMSKLIEEEVQVSSNSSSCVKLPRTTLRNESPIRRSVRSTNSSDRFKSTDRRSRSHDEHLDNDSAFNILRKADKSVSTDDLDCNSENAANRFLKHSRDMSTQCYGTLNRERNASTRSSLKIPSSKKSVDTPSVFERLSRYKASTSKDSCNGNGVNMDSKSELLKTNNPINGVDSKPRYPIIQKDSTTLNLRNKNLPPTGRRPSFRNYNTPIKSKADNISTRNENLVPYDKHQNGSSFKSHNTKEHSGSTLNGDNIKPFQSYNSTVGYLRGRQIPLSEVNINANRKFRSKSDSTSDRNSNFGKSSETYTPSFSSVRHMGTDLNSSIGLSVHKYLPSNVEHPHRRYEKNSSGSPKSYKPSKKDPVIDWSLSGFQLATRPENGVASDSEYTVHRRAPLLMYIPGISHHDQPAEEDDRLSALSGMSRSDLSSIGGYYDRNSGTDLRRRNSLPRDGKLKWWKSRG